MSSGTNNGHGNGPAKHESPAEFSGTFVWLWWGYQDLNLGPLHYQ